MDSTFFKLNLKDFGKGLLVAVLSAVITYLYQAVQNGSLATIDPSVLLQVAVGALLAYLLKNLVTNSDGKVLAGEAKK